MAASTRSATGRDDDRWMALALQEAAAALDHDDVPIGAVVAVGGQIVARAHNRREVDHDPTAHAEILALREAARTLGTWRLDDATLVVTLEPCAMCAGATVLARLGRLVFAADDPKAGAVGALYDIPRDPRLNHQVEVVRGIQADEASQLLKDFFRSRRATGDPGRP